MSAPDFAALGRRGGLATASRRDMNEVAAHARRNAPSSIDYWRAKVTEEFGDLPASDRDRRARAAQRLHFSNLARASAARRRRTSDATNAGTETRRSSTPGDVTSDVGRA
jgi:hypothetical protein